MPQSQIQSMPQDKFLLVAVNLLHKAIVEATRTEAKALYQQIASEKVVNLTKVQLIDDSIASFKLSFSLFAPLFINGQISFPSITLSSGA